MLPRNHLVTEYIRNNLNAQLTSGWDNYMASLTSPQRAELQKVIAFHRDTPRFVTRPEPSQRAVPLSPTTPRVREPHGSDIHIHIHNRYRQRSYWYDWFIFNSLMSSTSPCYQHHHHHRPASNRTTSKDEQNNAAAIILATLVVGCAVIASLYSLIEAGRCFEQLAYAEDVFGNMSRLAMTAFGAALGVGGGLLFGSAVLGMPVLGAICGALIFAGLAISASKMIVESVHRQTNDDSALAYDPRFCLSRKEEANLESAGYNAFAVSEAIRELAIQYDKAHRQASTLKFWSSDNKDKAIIIDKLRDLKKGWEWGNKSITIGEKHFNLEAGRQASEPVMGVPLETTNYPRGATAPPADDFDHFIAPKAWV